MNGFSFLGSDNVIFNEYNDLGVIRNLCCLNVNSVNIFGPPGRITSVE